MPRGPLIQVDEDVNGIYVSYSTRYAERSLGNRFEILRDAIALLREELDETRLDIARSGEREKVA